jgi:hypothetical protein
MENDGSLVWLKIVSTPYGYPIQLCKLICKLIPPTMDRSVDELINVIELKTIDYSYSFWGLYD